MAAKDVVLPLRRIAEEFPDLRWNAHRRLTHGWDHEVVILDEALVFRAPKADPDHARITNEATLLDYLRRRTSVGIPEYTHRSSDGSFVGYRLVAGRELEPRTFRRLSDAARDRIARQLASFISAMHSVPMHVARQFRAPEQDIRAEHETLARDTEDLILPRLERPEAEMVTRFLADVGSELTHEIERQLIHADLSPEHILWDRDRKEVNIIDFSDHAIGDPALDFAELHSYGHPLVASVFERYSGPKDERLLRRAALYFKWTPLETMIDALRGYPCTFEEGYIQLRQRFQSEA